MATAYAKLVDKERVVKVEKYSEREVTLTLTEPEARTLISILLLIDGSDTAPTKYVRDIVRQLSKCGIIPIKTENGGPHGNIVFDDNNVSQN